MKSHFFAGQAVGRCVREPGTRIVCVREVQKSLKDSVVQLIKDKIAAFGLNPLFEIKNDRIETPGGGVMLFQGMQDHTAESIKSLEGFDIAYVEEAQTLSSRSLEFLRPTIRKPGSELWFSWNPRLASDPVDSLLRGAEPPPNSIVVRLGYKDNPWFPDVLEQERQYDKVNRPDRYAHIWEGEYEPAAIGAIWDRLNINQSRRIEAPDLERVIVAVDPATSSDPGANEHGIIVAGLGTDGRGYVLADMTVSGSPLVWATQAVASFDIHSADRIVYEKNQGGEMVKCTLETVRPHLPLKDVWASRGKHARAEPIAALYKAGRVSHIGTFHELEDQMCRMTYDGYDGEGSPDRVDALVWALTELFPNMTRPVSKPDDVEAVIVGGEQGWMG